MNYLLYLHQAIYLPMKARLTLKLNKQTIEQAKKYASSKKISLSKLIEIYLNSITLDDKTKEREISPFVKSISSGKIIPSNLDEKDEYVKYLENKYK